MFGVVPKVLWSRTNPSDENNLCPWAMRSLLIEDGNRLILIDNGIGDKQDDRFLRHYYLHGDDTLKKSLNKNGFSEDDITDVFFTHLHFDHCGGAVNRKASGALVPAFKNAHFTTIKKFNELYNINFDKSWLLISSPKLFSTYSLLIIISVGPISEAV